MLARMMDTITAGFDHFNWIEVSKELNMLLKTTYRKTFVVTHAQKRQNRTNL